MGVGVVMGMNDDPFLAAAQGQILLEWWTLYVFSQDGALLALYQHPSLEVILLRRDELREEGLFDRLNPRYHVIRYIPDADMCFMCGTAKALPNDLQCAECLSECEGCPWCVLVSIPYADWTGPRCNGKRKRT